MKAWRLVSLFFLISLLRPIPSLAQAEMYGVKQVLDRDTKRPRGDITTTTLYVFACGRFPFKPQEEVRRYETEVEFLHRFVDSRAEDLTPWVQREIRYLSGDISAAGGSQTVAGVLGRHTFRRMAESIEWQDPLRKLKGMYEPVLDAKAQERQIQEQLRNRTTVRSPYPENDPNQPIDIFWEAQLASVQDLVSQTRTKFDFDWATGTVHVTQPDISWTEKPKVSERKRAESFRRALENHLKDKYQTQQDVAMDIRQRYQTLAQRAARRLGKSPRDITFEDIDAQRRWEANLP